MINDEKRNALIEEIAGRDVIASVSGGKDSTAMCLFLRELGIPYQPVFLDTGWENSRTYEYINDYLPTVIGEITHLRADTQLSPELEEIAQRFETRLGHHSEMVRQILKKGMFSSRQRRFCTQGLKAFVIRDFLKAQPDPINTVGVRGEESARRSKMPEWEHSNEYGCEIWRPLISWTTQDVIDIHTRHGVIPNPNYLAGASRVGCWPCVFSRKSEIRDLALQDPERIQIIADLEAEVLKLAIARYTARGESLEGLGYKPPSWFQNPIPPRRKDGSRNGEGWSIWRVVEWARTKDRNGRQFELFAPTREAGCMKWGLCDTSNTP